MIRHRDKIGILLADDHQIVREGLKEIIDSQKDMFVAAEASDGIAVQKMMQILRPEVVVVDVSMPNMNGMVATKLIKQKYSKTHVIALSMHADLNFVAGMLHAGAMAYLLKDAAADDLIQAIRYRSNRPYFFSQYIEDMVLIDLNKKIQGVDLNSETMKKISDQDYKSAIRFFARLENPEMATAFKSDLTVYNELLAEMITIWLKLRS